MHSHATAVVTASRANTSSLRAAATSHQPHILLPTYCRTCQYRRDTTTCDEIFDLAKDVLNQPKENIMRNRASSAGSSTKRGAGSWIVAGIAAMLMLTATSYAQAQEDGARKILKAMSDYVASQKVISLTYDSDIEVLTVELQKLQFTSSGQLMLSRPDRLRATRTGGYADVEFILDGKTFTVHDRENGAFAQAAAAGSVDQTIGRLRDEHFIEAPGADLLLSNSYATLTENVIQATHIGQGVIDGVECEHLAFRTNDTDWQIWIETGARPVPRKYVITSKGVTGAPQYTLRIKEWKTDAAIAANTFTFSPPATAKKLDFKELAQIDEVPAGTIVGGAQ
jgi:hypothetical protein